MVKINDKNICTFQQYTSDCYINFSKISIFLFYSVGRPKYKRVMAGAVEGNLFVGNKAVRKNKMTKINKLQNKIKYL